MKVRHFFLLSLFCLLLINHLYAATKDPLDLEKGEGTHSPVFTHPVQEVDVKVDIESAPKVSKSQCCDPIYETLLGSFLSLAGYGMITAGSIVAVESGLSYVSTPLLGIGGVCKQAGAAFFAASQQRAALLQTQLDDHVTKAKLGNLSAEEMVTLSDEFFSTSELYQTYLKYGLKVDGFLAGTLNFISIPVALVGLGFTASGEHTVGPILIASGAAGHELAGWFKSRIEELNMHKARIDAINAAKEKAGVR
ncbi:MAG: hypothetical protein K2W94_07145 [Alphaproteobacteria bacterium]|nr:hypothetical protein [Alphaproteobacteria bacterium]